MTIGDTTIKDSREFAYHYDLYIVPVWREAFDRLLDANIKVPEEGRFLDAGCGTGGYAVSLAINGGKKVEVFAVDSNKDRLLLAQGKAEVNKLNQIQFHQSDPEKLPFPDEYFDLVIGDVSMSPVESIRESYRELIRVAGTRATVALKIATRGSFDEFFSIYWEVLYELDLVEHTPKLETLITEEFTVTDIEEMGTELGLTRLKSVTKKERFDYKDAQSFLDDSLIRNVFLDHWLSILPDEHTRQIVLNRLVEVIDRERENMDFDVSVKATLIMGQKGH